MEFLINISPSFHYFESFKGNDKCLNYIQTVALIRTLAIRPDILLLDEAFSALDSQSRLKVSEDVYKIIKNEHKTAIMITHDINEAITLSERVIVLSKRPSTVLNIYEIQFENKRSTLTTRKEKNYNEYYDKIWKDLNHEIN